MRLILASLIASLLAAGVFAQTDNATYRLRDIGGELADSVQCREDGGKAALIAPIAESGHLAGSWTPYCLIAVK